MSVIGYTATPTGEEKGGRRGKFRSVQGIVHFDECALRHRHGRYCKQKNFPVPAGQRGSSPSDENREWGGWERKDPEACASGYVARLDNSTLLPITYQKYRARQIREK